MKKLSGQSLIILLLSIITAISLSVALWAVFLRPAPKVTDYAPAELEPNAVSYTEGVGVAEKQSSGGSVSIRYTKQVVVDTASKIAKLYYANPENSQSGVALQLILVDGSGKEAILGKSGLLKPGTKLEELNLEDADCKPGSYDGKFVLTFYDMDSGEKAILNTVVDGVKVVVE